MNTFHLAAGCAPLLAPSAGLSAKTEHTIKIPPGERVYVSVSPGARLDLKGTAGFRLATGNAYGPVTLPPVATRAVRERSR